MKKFIIAVLLPVTIFTVACTQTSAETDNIEQIIEKELGISPYIPSDELIGSVVLNYNNARGGEKGKPFSAEIEYKVSTDEELDNEMKEVWKDRDPLSEIIYGDLYMDPNLYTVTIFKDGTGGMDAEIIEIEGHEVQYQYIDRANEVIIMAIDFDDYGYMIEYYLEEGKTEENAKTFAEDIIRNVE